MLVAMIDGREMNARQISDYVFRTRGYFLHRKTVVRRITCGWSGEELLARPGEGHIPGKHRKHRGKTAIVDGLELTASEIVEHVERTRGYRLNVRTMRSRVSLGYVGDKLILAPQKKRNGHRPTVWEQALVRVAVPGWGVRVDA